MSIDAMSSAAPPGSERRNTGGAKINGRKENGTLRESERLNKACAEFEALLVQKLFQTMRASIPKSGLIDGGSAEAIYTGMLDQQVAEEMAFRGGLGLSDRMKAQILGRLNDLKSQND